MHWIERKLPFADLAVEPLGNPAIASLFVDDGMPGINPMRLHQPHYGHDPAIPNSVLRDFIEVTGREGMAGKFSVVPYPLGVGRIDQELPGVPDAVVREFVSLVRDHLMPQFDITPEILTHGPAIDPSTHYVTHLTEKEWGSEASATDFGRYIKDAFTLLANAGIRPTGNTSPWDTGADNEDALTLGVESAAVPFGLDLPFYFVHMAATAEEAIPEVRIMRRGGDGVPTRAVVSLRCGAGDPMFRCQYGKPANIDMLIGAEGGEPGELGAKGDAGAPMVMVTHWQSLYANGRNPGPQVLAEIASRLRARFGSRLAWWSADRMARLAAGAHALDARLEDGRIWLDLPLPLAEGEVHLSAPAGSRFEPDGARAQSDGAGGVVVRGPLEAGRLCVATIVANAS